MKHKEKGLSAWQLTTMALGTVIGGSFFLGSAVAVNAAGPAIILSFVFGGLLVYFILFALSEMTVANPDSGSFRTFTANVFGPGAGFVVGWVYWTGMALAMSSEAIAVSILLKNWFPNLSVPIFGSIIILGVTLLNLLGADKLSKLEGGLVIIKLFAVVSFIVLALLLIFGAIPGRTAVGAGELTREPFLSGGISSLAGSMLIVIFVYAGFEVIGLAASEAKDPGKTIPRAITYTVISLVGLYIVTFSVLLPLIPTSVLNENISPFVAALDRSGIAWAGMAVNFVLVTAILSTMLAAMFGLGRMMRSLAEEGDAPRWLKDKKDVPYRGIIFSGIGMLGGLGISLLFPRVYLFLISSGGFALLFTYAAILATHIRFRKCNGCPPNGKCQMPGYPFTSWFALISMIGIIASMPFISGQASGLFMGLIMIAAYTVIYFIRYYITHHGGSMNRQDVNYQPKFSEEISKEFHDKPAASCRENQENKLKKK